MRRVCLLCGLTLAGVVLLTGCSKSPAEQAKDARTTIASWNATVQLLEEQESRGVVPEVYGRQVRRAAEEARAKAKTKLQQAGSS